MTPITLNDIPTPNYGIAVAAQYRFYVAFTWWEEATAVCSVNQVAIINPGRQRFGGAILSYTNPTLDVNLVQKMIEQQEGHPVVVLFWREQE